MFIKARCIESRDRSSSSKTLYGEYLGWCDDSGIEPLMDAQFGRNLGKKGYQKYRMSAGNGWKGLSPRNEKDDAVEFENVFQELSKLAASKNNLPKRSAVEKTCTIGKGN
jgi:hypothetical protein